jgi:hypothetical protein
MSHVSKEGGLMRLTLDWDNISVKRFRKRMAVISMLFRENAIKWKRSHSGKGYHVEVYGVHGLNKEYIYNMRRWLSDDIRRINYDIDRDSKAVICNVLFDKKRRYK